MELDEHTLKKFLAIIEKLRNSLNHSIKWLKEDNLHFTLRFLGNISPSDIEPIYNAVMNQIQNIPPFTIELSRIITFPSSHPRIIGMGIELTQDLKTLLRALNKGLLEVGFPKEERAFLPHITLGRIRGHKKLVLHDENILLPKGYPVSHITFFQSVLTPQGSVYTPLQKIFLKM